MAYYAHDYPLELTTTCPYINQLEAINLVHDLSFLLPPNPVNFNIIVNTDNLSSQQVLKSGCGKDPVLCACARSIWLIAAARSCNISIVHKDGAALVLTDSLSRSTHCKVAYQKAMLECNKRHLSRISVSFSLDNIGFDV